MFLIHVSFLSDLFDYYTANGVKEVNKAPGACHMSDNLWWNHIIKVLARNPGSS
jgi:hypothetical protein